MGPGVGDGDGLGLGGGAEVVVIDPQEQRLAGQYGGFQLQFF